MTDTLDLKFLGKDYRVACGDGERDSLNAAAHLLDAKLTDFSGNSRVSGERLAIMAALDLAHELIAVRQMAGSPESLAGDTSLQRRITQIETRIQTALTQYESLF